MPRTVSAAHTAFPLATPFRISRGVKTVADVITVEIAAEGQVGRGEGVPYPRYGESVEQALAAVEAVRGPLESGADRAALLELMPAGAARTAVDCALWDLEARHAGRTVAEMLGRAAIAPVPTALTIGLGSIADMAGAARRLAQAPLIKVKVDGLDPAGQIRAVREHAPAPRMIVDPNEAWTMDDVEALQPLLQEMRVDLLEQPIAAGEDGALHGFTPLVPIAADESVHTAADIDRLAARYQVANIKLDKSGGLTAALELATAAEQAGLGLMVGCMICSSLSIAPALILAQRSAFVDLDGPLWLKQDRAGGVTEHGGFLSPPAAGFWGSGRS